MRKKSSELVSPPAIHGFLDRLKMVERKTFQFYLTLANFFYADTHKSDFWFTMAREENNHLLALELVTSLIRSSKNVSVSVDPSSDAILDKFLQTLQRFHEKLMINQVSWLDALRMAIEVETSPFTVTLIRGHHGTKSL